jgi:phosphoribosylformylglycinamidine cyclo-ligase
MRERPPLTYAEAGVSLDAADAVVDRLRAAVESTRTPLVLGSLGGFAGLVSAAKFSDPVLAAGTDTVGSKALLQRQTGRLHDLGIDLVAMSVNDVLVQGAEPLFFLDYFACGKLDNRIAADVVKGIARGCELAGCALIGGETAEMPGMYPAGEYDLAGFCVGVVEKERIIDGRSIAPGDVLLGLASSGPHSNGFSLIRKILERSKPDAALLDALMAPTRIYVKPVLALLEVVPVKALAHITGGGLTENVPRVLQKNLMAKIDKSSWPRPAFFSWLQREGNVAEDEMHRVFNCGIGMVIVVAAENARRAAEHLRASGETVYEIGRVEAAPGEASAVVV